MKANLGRCKANVPFGARCSNGWHVCWWCHQEHAGHSCPNRAERLGPGLETGELADRMSAVESKARQLRLAGPVQPEHVLEASNLLHTSCWIAGASASGSSANVRRPRATTLNSLPWLWPSSAILPMISHLILLQSLTIYVRLRM